MGLRPLFFCLAGTVLAAQGFSGAVGLQSWAPDLRGRVEGTQDGQPTDADFQQDLGLARDGLRPGLFAELRWRRWGLALDSGEAHYAGDVQSADGVYFGGLLLQSGRIQSDAEIRTLRAVGSFRFLDRERGFAEAQLSAEHYDLDATATGTTTTTGPFGTQTQVQQGRVSDSFLVPSLGLEGGLRFLGGRLELRARVRYAAWRGASYGVGGAELRARPWARLGLRAFWEDEHLDVPQGSVAGDLAVNASRRGAGFGVFVDF